MHNRDGQYSGYYPNSRYGAPPHPNPRSFGAVPHYGAAPVPAQYPVSRPMTEEYQKQLVLEQIDRALQERKREREREEREMYARERGLQSQGRPYERAYIPEDDRLIRERFQREEQERKDREMAQATLMRQVERERKERERRLAVDIPPPRAPGRGPPQTREFFPTPPLAEEQRYRRLPPPDVHKKAVAPKVPPKRGGKGPDSPLDKTQPKFMTTVPLRGNLTQETLNFLDLRSRFPRLRIARDFTTAHLSWLSQQEQTLALPLHAVVPFFRALDSREVQPTTIHSSSGNRKWQSKVMLFSGFSRSKIASIAKGRENILQMIHFLVGRMPQTKNGVFCIGGTWSPDLDGPSPDTNPQALIRAAIRNCLEQTSIDLSACTQWIRFVDINYHRPQEVIKGVHYPEQLVTTVIWLPDIWNHIPYLEQSVAQFKLIRNVPRSSSDVRDNTPSEKPPVDAALLSQIKSELLAELTTIIQSNSSNAEQVLQNTLEQRLSAALSKEAAKEPKEIQTESSTREEKSVSRHDEEPKVASVVYSRREGEKDPRTMTSSLESLLTYSADDVLEKTFEVSLFAELFVEMVQYRFGHMLLKFLKTYSKMALAKEAPTSTENEGKREDEQIAQAPLAQDSTLAREADEERHEGHADQNDDMGMAHTSERHDEDHRITDDKSVEDLNESVPESSMKRTLSEDEDSSSKRLKVEPSADEAEASFTTTPADIPEETKSAPEQTLTQEEQDLADDLLLAFSFFDPRGHYYVAKPDLCLVIHSLGKNLSQRNILSFVEPIVVKERLNYKDALPQVVKQMLTDQSISQ
eukprot:c9823_g1_i7.p1 GENE.c9823_g1_i7~~c9823_g1_i7.p1  ORF type:complete len:808 (-),score=159.13 c9823_g1_i7:6-2429(-)